MAEHGFARTLGWVHEGSALLHKRLGELGDTAAEGPSLLPDWSRAHVLTHLARNADALVNLLTWARTGVETPMYPDPATRLDDIERGAKRPPAEVLADVREADARLLAAINALPGPAWHATVRSALDRTIPATEIPWMRTREIWIHRIDLGTGDDFDTSPADLTDALLAEASVSVGGKDGCRPVLLRPDDREQTHRLGPDGMAQEVNGPAAALCAWLLGRNTPLARTIASGTDVALPPWL